jgi:hypothetical protein
MQIEEIQQAFCCEREANFVAAPQRSISGFALSTKGQTPINGLRHPMTGESSGWYIWCGEKFSEDPDFFSPIHTGHLYEDYPELIKFLGLSPGYRFLLSGTYVDVWYDDSLLNI